MAYADTHREPIETVEPQERVRHERRETTAKVVAGGSSTEALAGAGAVALAIIGLAGVLPVALAAISTIAVGGALLLEGGAIAARLNQIAAETGDGIAERLEVGGGASAQMLGGAAGVALGILALVGLAPISLLAIAAIVFGGTMVFGGPTLHELNAIAAHRGGEHETMRFVTREAVNVSAGAMSLVGLGAATLGILVLAGVGPAVVLILVAMLGIGGSILMSGAAVTGRMGAILRTA
jgi:hypothetical protein